MNKYCLAFATILFVSSLFLTRDAIASTQTFDPFLVDLKPGSSHPDVLRLQKYLNTNNFPVASFGPGSIGSETTYFGIATKKALINFQNFYKERILAPQGLTAGSGNFYSATRNFINSKEALLVEVLPTDKERVSPSTPTSTSEAIMLPPPPALGINLTQPSIYGRHRRRSVSDSLTDPTITFNGTTGTNDGSSFPYLVATVNAISNSDGSITYFLASGDPAQFSVNASTGQIYALNTGASGSIQIGATQSASGQYNSKTVYATVVIFNLI